MCSFFHLAQDLAPTYAIAPIVIGALISAISAIASAGIGAGVDAAKNKKLTGAEREANDFTASEALKNREFQSAEAEIGRQWEEDMYLKYESPEARIRQYQEAGLNPSLMYGNASSGSAPMSTSVPSGSAVSSVSHNPFSVITSMLQIMSNIRESSAQIRKTNAEIENIDADTRNKEQAYQWNPQLWESQLKTGEVDRQNMLAGIDLAKANIKHLGVQDVLSDEMRNKIKSEIGKINAETVKINAETGRIEVDTRFLDEKVVTEILNQGLISAQTVLTNSSAEKVSLEASYEAWSKDFREHVGYSPDKPVWNAVTSYLGSVAKNVGTRVDKLIDRMR